jgi:hypothetical protein
LFTLRSTVDGRRGALRQNERVVRSVQDREQSLRRLPVPNQQEFAVALASLVEPVALLDRSCQPRGGLTAVADVIRQASTDVEIDRARHLLFSIPEMLMQDEPVGLAWFPYRASIAWIYAADSKCTSPCDGVVNTFKCALDILDALDGMAGDGTLVDETVARTDDVARLALLRPEVERAVDELAAANQ